MKALIHATLATVPVVSRVTPAGVIHSVSESAFSTPVGSDIFLNVSNNLALSLLHGKIGARVHRVEQLCRDADTRNSERACFNAFMRKFVF